MGKIHNVEKMTDNRFVNLYHVDATSVHNTPVSYYVASRAKDVPALKLKTGRNDPDGVIIYSEMYEETGLKLEPLKVDPAFEKPYFTTVGMTDESCATVYGYASGEISKAAQEDSEEIEIVLADRTEVKRILKEERVAIMCAYMLMHFLKDEDPFEFLN